MAFSDLKLFKIYSLFYLCALYIISEASFISSYHSNTLQAFASRGGIPKCPLRQFQCKNDQCIQYKWLCDGEDDCGDNSDETFIDCRVKRNCTSSEFRCGTELCIPDKWLCDGQKDCSDDSDESPELCESLQKCLEGMFKCSSDGMCIPDNWKCDGKPDCHDKSDEMDCHFSCASNEFTCGDGHCIKKRFVCDGEEDCEDGKDEANCSRTTCKPNEFLCHKDPNDVRCIPTDWVCDGQNDCSSGEDEIDCKNNNLPQKNCIEDEWLCADKKTCIHTDWLCDGANDCSDASDESPSLCANLTCRADEFMCKNRQCIPGFKHCDRSPDCFDSSDEENCNYHRPSCGDHEYDCGDNVCIDSSKLCDGSLDCPLGEDEPEEFCHKNECSSNNGGCSHKCVDDPIGYHCTCPSGYQVVNKTSCHDVDECSIPGSCSHKCYNTEGSFRCECYEGYYLDPNNFHACKALHGPGSLIFTKRQDIQRVSLEKHYDRPDMESILDDSKAASAMDFLYKTGQIFWIETANSTIFKAPINAGFAKTIVIGENVNKSDGLAVDWIYDHIYWTDAAKSTIEMAKLDGSMRKVLINTNLDLPRSIAVNPLDGWLFWSDWGTEPRIERAGMDGTHRNVIISNGISWPNGITLDLVRNKIYWVDAKLYLLSSANYDGSERKTILKSRDYLHLPYSLTIFEDTVYWSDWDKQTIFKANKFNGSNVEPIDHGKMVHNPMIVHVYHPNMQPKSINYCLLAKEQCSHICSPAPKINERSPKISCLCPDGMILEEYSTKCIVNRPPNQLPTVTNIPQNTINIEETIVDIEVNQEDTSGFVAVVFVIIASIVVFFCAALMFVVYRHYIHKNVTSMNFENFIYKKTTTSANDDQYDGKSYNLSVSQRLYKPPSPVQSNDDSRTPLNSSIDSTATELV